MKDQPQSLFALLFSLIVQGTLGIQVGYAMFGEGYSDLLGLIWPIIGATLMISSLLAWAVAYGLEQRRPWAARRGVAVAVLALIAYGLAIAFGFVLLQTLFGALLALASLVGLLLPRTRRALSA